MATPTLTMIPSGYKAQKVYSVLPINGDGDFTFDRTTTATRVNKNGLIEQVATDVPRLDYPINYNLVSYSEDFTNPFWETGGSIRTSGFLSPSGELNACLVKGGGYNHMASYGMSLPSLRTYTLSVYLKASTPTTVTLKLQELGGNYTNYSFSEITLTNEWVRYEVTGQKAQDGNLARIVIDGIADEEEFFIWGAQLEEQPYATPYIPTPRGGCPSLLLEPTSTNLVIGSAEGNYQHLPASLTNTISPDGTNNAVIPTPQHIWIRYQETIPAGTYLNGQKLTYSWYRKRISTPTGISRTGDLDIRGLTNLTSLESNNATQIESNINGFDRFQAVVEIIDGSLESEFRAYIGDVVGVGNSSVAYFGHQFEALPYATSYIPTTSGTESRAADSASKDGLSSYISSTAGVLYAELKALSSESTNQRWIYIGDGSIDNFVAIVYMPTSNELVAYGLNGGNSSLYISTTNYNLTDDLKVAIKWKENDSQLYINGSLIDTDTATQDFNFTFSELRLEGSAANKFYGKVKDLRVYNTALTDLELQELTTI